MKKLTQEDRDRIKKNFLNSKFGRNLDKFLHEYKGIWIINAIFIWEFCFYFILGTLQLTDFTPLKTGNILSCIALCHAYTHHLTDLMCFGIGYTFLVIRMKNALYPAIWIGFIIATSEYSWWLSYIIAHYQQVFIYDQWERIYFSNNLIPPYTLLIIGYGIIKGFDKRDLIWIGFIWIFMLAWIALGFPITYDFSGVTPLVNDLQTNLIEVSHWIWNFTGFFIIVDYMKTRIKWIK